MGAALRKSVVVANDRQRMPVAPVLLPISGSSLPRVIPFVRLEPLPQPRTHFSFAALIAVTLLAILIFMLGIIAGTVFWFTYDSRNATVAAAPSAVMARLAPPVETMPVLSPTPIVEEVAPADIILPAEETVSTPAAALNTPPQIANDMQLVVHEGDATDMDVMLEQAQAKLEEGQNDIALVMYERVLADYPKNHAALEGKTYALARLGRHDIAIKAAHNLIQIDPKNATARDNLIKVLGASSTPEALTELQHMLAATPRDAVLEVALAKVFTAQGKIDEALTHLIHALQLEPANITMRFDLAVLYDRAGQGSSALALYRQILQGAGEGNVRLPSSTIAEIAQRTQYLAGLNAGP